MINTSSTKACGQREATPLNTDALNELSSVLGRIFSVRLDVPEFVFGDTHEKKVKEFCVGLLENPVNHAWWQTVRSLGLDERTSVAGSLFLARKALPFLPDPRQAEKHMRLMSAPAPDVNPEFLKFAEREISSLFKLGWDKRYQSHVYSHTPTSSACLEYPRSKGGARRWLSEQGQDWFSDACLGDAPCPNEYFVKYALVQTGGKQRGVTKASAFSHVLGPLHRTLYDHLSQFEWLLRGDARGKKFKSFQQVEGEVFVSGDYENATDNLSLEATEFILAAVLRNCRSVPFSIRDYALRSLRAKISYPGGRVVEQQRGQLMGNYLSFPLLCLQNYLAFRFAISRTVPVRINGDDIVFRCRPSEYKTWKETVQVAGLTLSVGKTLVHKSIFSVNSCFFRAGNRRVWEIPVIRLNSAVTLSENPLAGGAFTKFIRGWKGLSRRLLGAMWLRHRRQHIQATGRSVEALGIPADNSQLHTANLAVRESFFRGSKPWLRLLEVPLPAPPLERGDNLSENWVCAPLRHLGVTGRQASLWQKEYRDSAAASVWLTVASSNRVLWNQWWKEVKSHSRESQWQAWKRTSRHVHAMGFNLNPVLRPPAERDRFKRSWIPRLDYNQLSRSDRGGVGVP